jgi:hypothetical protein
MFSIRINNFGVLLSMFSTFGHAYVAAKNHVMEKDLFCDENY